MGFFSKLFKGQKIEQEFVNPVYVDLHSHLLPGLDDGVESFEESIEIIRTFKAMGYKKLITTPHVMGDTYQNTNKDILDALKILRQKVKDENIDIEIAAAAEYYMDESLMPKIKEHSLLTLYENYVLVETSFLSEIDYFDAIIFELKVNGYMPILAHPERYMYMYSQKEKYKVWKEHDILFQVNINSLAGYYSNEAKKVAEMLIQQKMVNFVGSDLHHARHFAPLERGLHTKAYFDLTEQGLLNNTFL